MGFQGCCTDECLILDQISSGLITLRGVGVLWFRFGPGSSEVEQQVPPLFVLNISLLSAVQCLRINWVQTVCIVPLTLTQ
jgi:hypothetical protein